MSKNIIEKIDLCCFNEKDFKKSVILVEEHGFKKFTVSHNLAEKAVKKLRKQDVTICSTISGDMPPEIQKYSIFSVAKLGVKEVKVKVNKPDGIQDLSRICEKSNISLSLFIDYTEVESFADLNRSILANGVKDLFMTMPTREFFNADSITSFVIKTKSFVQDGGCNITAYIPIDNVKLVNNLNKLGCHYIAMPPRSIVKNTYELQEIINKA